MCKGDGESDMQKKLSAMNKVVKHLAKKELQQLASSVHARICRGRPYAAEALTKTGFGELVDTNVEASAPFANKQGWDLQAYKACVVESFCDANMHAVDVKLQQQAEECQAYVDLMEDFMPYECALVSDFEWVKANLFSLQA